MSTGIVSSAWPFDRTCIENPSNPSLKPEERSDNSAKCRFSETCTESESNSQSFGNEIMV